MKRISLEQTAQLVMDLYYKNYKQESEFFVLTHFIYLCCTTYAKIINDMYAEEKKKNKDSDGFSFANFSGPWLLEEWCEIKKNDDGVSYIETSMPCFVFDFDALASSVHSIQKGAKGQCGDVMRLSNKDYWKIDKLPVTGDIYWYQLGEKILLPNLKCDPGKLKTYYLPALLPSNPQCMLPETMADGIITTTLEIMFGAKKETMLTKMANNSNPNTTETSEVAQSSQQQQQ